MDGWEKRWRGEKRREDRGRKNEQWRHTYQGMEKQWCSDTTAVTYYNTRCTWVIGEDHFACMYYRLPNTTHPHFAHYIKASMGRGCLIKCPISLMDTTPNTPPPYPLCSSQSYTQGWQSQRLANLLNLYYMYVHRKPVALVLILSREASNQLLSSVHGARRWPHVCL